LFGPPLPGYDAHAQRLVDAAQRAMDQLLDILGESGDGTLEPPADSLASQLAAWAQPRVPGIGPVAGPVLAWDRQSGEPPLDGGFTPEQEQTVLAARERAIPAGD
jgi:hypothetical protein